MARTTRRRATCCGEADATGSVTALKASNNRALVTGGVEVRVWEIRTREMVAHLKSTPRR